jgi:hypothetical protein
VASEQEWDEDRLRFASGPTVGSVEDLASTVGPLAEQFVRLAESLAAATTVHGVLVRVSEATLSAVPGADLVSVTLRADDRFHTPVETDPLASRLDEIQYRLDEGPGVEATRTPGMGVAFCRDLAAGAPYPRFGPLAAEHGVSSVLAVGLFPGGLNPRFGSLNIYSRTAGGLDELDRDLALVLAAHASTALAGTIANTAAELELATLRQAISSRDVIGQAKGILMERRGITADEAFQVLRNASQSLNVKLTQVAETVVERRAEF